jgi:hypothetical protein
VANVGGMNNQLAITTGTRQPARRQPIPREVKAAINAMIYGLETDPDGRPLDLASAARAAGVAGFRLRRWLHKPNVIGYLRAQRRLFREQVCAGNEAALARVRDTSENGMVTVAAVRALEAIDAEDGGRPVNAQSGGVAIRIINVHGDRSPPPVINVTPNPKPEPAEPLPAPPVESPDDLSARFVWPRPYNPK